MSLHAFSPMLSGPYGYPSGRDRHIVTRPLLSRDCSHLHSLSIAPHDPNRRARRSQPKLHALEYALDLPPSFPPRTFRIRSHRTLVRRLCHHVATQRQGFQVALSSAPVRTVELCGCVRCDGVVSQTLSLLFGTKSVRGIRREVLGDVRSRH